MKLSEQLCQRNLDAILDALFVLNGRWKLVIIAHLSEGNKRYSELQKAVTGITSKVLSAELKSLELNGFIVRRVYDTYPVLINYELTDYSKSLEDVIDALQRWGYLHREKLRRD